MHCDPRRWWFKHERAKFDPSLDFSSETRTSGSLGGSNLGAH